MSKYTKDQKNTRELLPETSLEAFDDIIFSRKLGANRHITMIGNMMMDVVESSNDKNIMTNKLDNLTSFFKETRGNQSRAVYNGIVSMEGYKSLINEKDLKESKTIILDYISAFSQEAKKSLDNIIKYANNLSEEYEAVMLFDYSSTLNEYILNSYKNIKLYIPESRALDGGKPYIEACQKNGNETYFIPDTTIMENLKKCDAAFIGAESFYADGTAFNTIGSDIIAVVCKYLNVPLYVLTPLIKLDERNIRGIKKLSPMPYNYSERLAGTWKDFEKENIEFHGIKLAQINPEHISGYITEVGIVPSSAMYNVSLEYLKNIGGEEIE